MESENHGYMGKYLNVEMQAGETLVRVVIDEEDGEKRVTIYEDDNVVIFEKTYEDK
jgi:hypothetical protein